MSGNVEFTTKMIAQKLGADLLPIMPVKAYPDSGFKKFFWGGKSAVMGEEPELAPYSFDQSAYDTVILGAPVWAGTFAPPLRSFIKQNCVILQSKRLAAFLCCSGGAGKAMDKLKAFVGASNLLAELVLTDPKDKPSSENEAKIAAFCNSIQ